MPKAVNDTVPTLEITDHRSIPLSNPTARIRVSLHLNLLRSLPVSRPRPEDSHRSCVLHVRGFVLLLPIAALTVRAPLKKIRVTRLHTSFQVANVILAVVDMGLGSSVATTRDIPKGSASHILLGYVIISLLVIAQPVIDILQHLFFRKTGRRRPLDGFICSSGGEF
jgi:hypothetical protein